MKILVTGATGLIGQRLVYRLFEEGHDLVLLGRDLRRLKETFPLPCRFLAWPSGDNQGALPALAGVDAVIHLAGESIAAKRWSHEQKFRIRNSRVVSTRRLVDLFLEHSGANPRVFLCASAIGIYGDRKDEVLDESSPPGSGYLPEVCTAWEKEARRAQEISPTIRCVQLRIGMVLAREGGALSRMTPIFDAGLGGPIGTGQQWMSWIHVDDVVGIILHSLENTQITGAVNAVSPRPVSNRDFSFTLASVLHKPDLMHAPKNALRLAFGEMSEVVLASQRVIPLRLLESGYDFRYPYLQEALDKIYPSWYSESAREFVTLQWIPRPPDEVFPFFSQAENLEQITPPWLKFEVLGKSTSEIREGTRIDYRLRLHGLPLRWQSRIIEWLPNQKFVDIQTQGPYSLWRHTHLFKPVQGGTLLTDRVLYKLPLGALGSLIAGAYVQSDVRKIFEYRQRRIEEPFPPSPSVRARSA